MAANGSAYGKRSGRSAFVRRRPQRASFLGSVFAAYRQCSQFFAGVAVRIAVQASGVQDPHVENASFKRGLCNRFSIGLLCAAYARVYTLRYVSFGLFA